MGLRQPLAPVKAPSKNDAHKPLGDGLVTPTEAGDESEDEERGVVRALAT